MSSNNGPAVPKASAAEIPILLLKTRSVPHDGYWDYFSQARSSLPFSPTFVPVLDHKFNDANLRLVRELLEQKQFGPDGKYGGMIFTSQRAVEAFARIVEEGTDTQAPDWPNISHIPLYTVGPATSRALTSMTSCPALQIFGASTGNGEALAQYMLTHYREFYSSMNLPRNPPILFLVGEQRRDIIPKTLMDPQLSERDRIPVIELEVYETGVMETFPAHFSELLHSTASAPLRWVVVFSPTGCEAMLRELDMLDAATGKVKTGERGGGCGVRRGRRNTYIATIGPTTRDYLRRTFGFEADVCAERPTPEGVGEGIRKFVDGMEIVETVHTSE